MPLNVTPPTFWQRKCLAAKMLSPIAGLYRLGTLCHRALTKQRPDFPVPLICVGNAVLGGAGKTPVTRQLAQAFMAQGKNVHIILKGYGGTITTTTQVDITRHTWTEVGDEAYLYAVNGFSTWIGKDRYATALAAYNAGADFLICDDGLQDYSMPYSKRLLVVDKSYGVGNGHTFPAGPLREPIDALLSRIDGIIGLGYETNPFPNTAAWFESGCRTLRIPPSVLMSPVVAFAGIGNPYQFFELLAQHDFVLKATQPFPDHYPYSPKDITSLVKIARNYNARLITTEKDYYRVPNSLQSLITPILLEITFKNPRIMLNVG